MKCEVFEIRKGGAASYQCWKSIANLFTHDSDDSTEFEFAVLTISTQLYVLND